ncbi:MAG: D-glycero-beta-D-manno-heptose-7-phosphate kinase [Candidatus Cloacimonas sp. 4484_209]|nr:MAG: D-glycero-beta-D-manno-heptose-7-phosphate kinase [Candidatus Cloacimonas sp. 4484_209]
MKRETVTEILDRVRDRRIAIIGDVMLDEYFWGNVERISPEAPVPIVNVKGHSYSLGGAANVALNASSLGAKPILIGVIGDDDDGKILKSLMGKNHLNKTGIFVDKKRTTTLKKRIIAHHQQVVRVDIEDNFPITGIMENKIFSFLKKSLKDIDAVIIEDYNKGLLTKPLIKNILSFTAKKNLIVTVDPKFENFFDYSPVTLFKPNLKELEKVGRMELTNMDNIVKYMRNLQRKINAKAILVTMGERGMVLVEKGKKAFSLKPHSLDVFDVTGAGDTVITAVTLALAAGYTIKEATEFSSIVAAIEVSKLGAAVVTPKEIKKFVISGELNKKSIEDNFKL